MYDLKVLLWNVNGLNDRLKRGAVLSYVKRMTATVIFLQETHMLGTRCPFLHRYGYDSLPCGVHKGLNWGGGPPAQISAHGGFTGHP